MKNVRKLADELKSAVIASIEVRNFKIAKIDGDDYVTLDVGGVEVSGYPIGILPSLFLLGERLNVSEDGFNKIKLAANAFADEARKQRVSQLKAELAQLESV